jgi:hypothetical protein
MFCVLAALKPKCIISNCEFSGLPGETNPFHLWLTLTKDFYDDPRTPPYLLSDVRGNFDHDVSHESKRPANRADLPENFPFSRARSDFRAGFLFSCGFRGRRPANLFSIQVFFA